MYSSVQSPDPSGLSASPHNTSPKRRNSPLQDTQTYLAVLVNCMRAVLTDQLDLDNHQSRVGEQRQTPPVSSRQPKLRLIRQGSSTTPLAHTPLSPELMDHPWARYHVVGIQLCSLAYLEVAPCHKPASDPPCSSAPLVPVRVQSSTPSVTGIMSHKGGYSSLHSSRTLCRHPGIPINVSHHSHTMGMHMHTPVCGARKHMHAYSM